MDYVHIPQLRKEMLKNLLFTFSRRCTINYCPLLTSLLLLLYSLGKEHDSLTLLLPELFFHFFAHV